MKYALIRNGIVDTVSYQPVDGWAEVPDDVFAGFVVANGKFSPPVKPGADYEWTGSEWVHVPPDPAEALAAERAGMRAFRLASALAMRASPAPAPHQGTMWQVLQAKIQDDGPDSDIAIWWENVTELIRVHPQMEDFREEFNLTPEQLDDFFRLAMAIERGEA